MATKSARIPKGFIELHTLKNGLPVLMKVDMIGFLYPVTEDRSNPYNIRQVDYTHICNLAHNNGGMDVKESYDKVVKMMKEAGEAA